MTEPSKRMRPTRKAPMLFQPIGWRSVESRNRIAVAPMCQYSAQEGVPNDWHLVHLGAMASGGAGIILTEATAVEARGQISPNCLGLWNDDQQEAFSRITAFINGQGAVPGIQLAHAGRKASTAQPWEGGAPLSPESGAWPIIGPSAIPFAEGYPTPEEMSDADLRDMVTSFAASAKRAKTAGFRLAEVHAAHGYLLHSFLSPLSNQRGDRYGGSLENRARLLMEIIDAVRAEWPDDLPLWVRLSCSDWVAGGWDLPESIELAAMLKARGDVDLLDCSSGGNSPDQQMPIHPGYQVPFADAIRRKTGLPTGAVGLIRDARQAEEIIANGRADVVLLARMLLADPHWPQRAAETLGWEIPWPKQYLRGNLAF